jgi:2-polyprenyl-3-methyl-5-hydroxy-6-metoxy-1,4-benzoquinol methylase
MKTGLESVRCPSCGGKESGFWAEEAGFNVVRCKGCRFLYVNPRPCFDYINEAVRSGRHSSADTNLNVRSRRIPGKVALYRRLFAKAYSDLWETLSPITWLDVGAGYGEILEAVSALAPRGSTIIGCEPMHHKADIARANGLNVVDRYLGPKEFQADVISIIDIFSHVPNFAEFLAVVASNLAPNGSLFIETGNLADLGSRREFPGELGLPDHLAFAGEKHLINYLSNAGFDVLEVQRQRIDNFRHFAKNTVKWIIGRPSVLAIPYTSNYRQIRIKAKLRVFESKGSNITSKQS